MEYKSKFKAAEIDARLEKMVKVTYAELKALRDEGKLIAGQMYRMTDYETTCTWADTQVAGHPFDLVLTALDERTLDEKCSAIWSARDTDGYFANSNIPAWDVRYCLDNDTERFVWRNADGDMVTWVDSNGKGVIYRLIDESRNDVPYDFKNIMFSRPLTEGMYDAENGVDTFCYTFCCIDWDTLEIADQSVKESAYCYDNKFDSYCYNNVFLILSGDNCNSNTFGSHCYDNTFGSYCDSNTFGTYCYSNTFGAYCCSNTFGDYFYSNIFGENLDSNTFGHYCYSNIFGDNCYYNTFGDYLSGNVLDYCMYCYFGDNCYNNTLQNGPYYNINLGYDVYYCTFSNDETTSDSYYVQNYKVDRINHSEIQVYCGREYDTYITKDKSGNIVEYTVNDIINTQSNTPT